VYAVSASVTDAAVPNDNAAMQHRNPVPEPGIDIEILDDLPIGS